MPNIDPAIEDKIQLEHMEGAHGVPEFNKKVIEEGEAEKKNWSDRVDEIFPATEGNKVVQEVKVKPRVVNTVTGEIVKTQEPKMDNALVPQEKQTAHLQVMNPRQLEAAMKNYRETQKVIDKMLPDSIMTIGYGEKAQRFRKKPYWRAVGIAFSLRVQCSKEEIITLPDGNWGYAVTYRAERPNGSYAEGDGICMASDKTVYKWKKDEKGKAYKSNEVDEAKTRQNQTAHNIRSHAHTRAFNRAVSNCVGFGEVSAEEVQ